MGKAEIISLEDRKKNKQKNLEQPDNLDSLDEQFYEKLREEMREETGYYEK